MAIIEAVDVGMVTGRAAENLEVAEQLYRDTKQEVMNEVAEAMCSSEPVADIRPFLLAMHGIRAVRYNEGKSEQQQQYEELEKQFGLHHIGTAFSDVSSGSTDAGKSLHLCAYSDQSFNDFMRNRRTSYREEYSAVQYSIRKDHKRYIGRLVVPAYKTDFESRRDGQRITQMNYTVATIKREIGEDAPYNTEVPQTAFGSDLAAWARGHHSSRYAAALMEVATGEKLLQDAVPKRATS